MDYRIVYVDNNVKRDALIELEEKVNRLCRDGWKLQGGISVTTNKNGGYLACQAMVR